MVTVYIIRHCEAEGNVLGVFQGSSDFDISRLGESQLKFLSERFRDIHIDRVYSSPLIRAYKTALAVAKPHGLEVIADNELREINGGIIEGMKLSDIFVNYPDLEYKWQHEFQNFAPENGEAIRDAYRRIWQAVSRIAKENHGKTIAIASHGGVIRSLICRLVEGDIEKIGNVRFSTNTAVTKIIFDDNGVPSVCFVNDDSHLPRELLPASSRIENQGIKNGVK